MSRYVDGFVIPIPETQIETYRKIASEACKVWMDHGALDYCECVGEDLDVKDQVPFPKLAGAQTGEAVIFAWILYKSREHRDEVNAKVMKDPRIAAMGGEQQMPFDCKRMAYGGFKTIVEASKTA